MDHLRRQRPVVIWSGINLDAKLLAQVTLIRAMGLVSLAGVGECLGKTPIWIGGK